MNKDPQVNDKLQVLFLENYSVSLAEKIIPAADVSEQISTAGKEASGTGNMKFMMNGALTIGTLDGANVEMFELLGNENMFLFGLKLEEVLEYYRTGAYVSRERYEQDPRIARVLNQLISSGPFCCHELEFGQILQSLLDHNDEFFVLADFASYVATQSEIDRAYLNTGAWTEKSIMNMAHAGHFSSDNTIHRYASDIWNVSPVKVGVSR